MNKTDVIKVLPIYVDGKKYLKKAVGYARVSTESEEQDSSYALQIKELKKDIKSNPDYRYLGVFKDKATGTNSKYRNEFKIMIKLARKKEIDVIVTKSISRFGRNLTETVSVVRELRSLGVEIVFQKENISSFDESFDFLFSVLASHAEEESKNISDNNQWSIDKRKRNGENFTYKLYGYKITNKQFHIVEDEAKVVRKIYDLYINGSTYKDIIAFLHEKGIKSISGNDYWSRTTLESMLKNEKYCGDMLLGRKTASSELTELVLVQNNHVGVISKETFNLAQKVRTDRRKQHPGTGSKLPSPYAGWIYSSVNERYLRYVVEKPKGRSGRVKSEIPTLFCYGLKPGTKRIAYQVKVVEDFLNQIIDEFKPRFISHTFHILKDLTDMVSALELSNRIATDDFSPLVHKLKIEEMLASLRQIRKIMADEQPFTIESYRKVFRKIIINDDSIHIKITLSNDDSVFFDRYSLIHETEFTYLKLFKPITLPIFVYLEKVSAH